MKPQNIKQFHLDLTRRIPSMQIRHGTYCNLIEIDPNLTQVSVPNPHREKQK